MRMRRQRNIAPTPRSLPVVQEDSALGWHALVLEKPHFCLVQPRRRRSASKGGKQARLRLVIAVYKMNENFPQQLSSDGGQSFHSAVVSGDVGGFGLVPGTCPWRRHTGWQPAHCSAQSRHHPNKIVVAATDEHGASISLRESSRFSFFTFLRHLRRLGFVVSRVEGPSRLKDLPKEAMQRKQGR